MRRYRPRGNRAEDPGRSIRNWDVTRETCDSFFVTTQPLPAMYTHAERLACGSPGEGIATGSPRRSVRFRPVSLDHRAAPELPGIEDDVLHPLALPGVGDVHEAIARLNDGRITEFFFRLLLEHACGFPRAAVLRNRDIERRPLSAPLTGNTCLLYTSDAADE